MFFWEWNEFLYTSAEGIRKRSSSVTTKVPKKGILKTNQPSSVSNHGNEGKQQQHIIWGQGSEVEVRPCCCCPQVMMHPDDHYGGNYVSHCHTENSRWRPNVAVLQHQPQSLTNETQRTPIALKSRKSPVSPQISRGDSIDLFHIQKAPRTGTKKAAPRTPPLKKKNEKRGGTEAISEAARTTSSSSKVV